MKKSLIAVAFVLAASMAMAHGPPSALDSNIVAATSSSPSIGSGTDTVASAKSVSGTTSTGALVAVITKTAPGVARQSRPVNERMLN